MSHYGQFCPVAKAAEVLDERWTLLVVRELLLGSRRFNDLRRGVPRMSPALLSKRLRELERAGVVERVVVERGHEYALTPAGQELRGLVEALGAWGARWVGDLGDADLDPHLLFWDVRRCLPVQRWPRGRTAVAFVLTDVPARESRWWVVVSRSLPAPGAPDVDGDGDGDAEVDVCSTDPGHPVQVEVRTTLRDLTLTWRGDTDWQHLLARAEVVGPEHERRALPARFGQSALAAVPRPAVPGPVVSRPMVSSPVVAGTVARSS